MFSGDVLFAGSIGRTDLAGGSTEAMTDSLRDVVLPLADSTLVLPGHGPATTMKRERATNPYLQGLGPVSKIAPISGFPEFSPAERIVEQRFLDVIRETFELARLLLD
jgi:glyoxylase-like metal-dependent hydrolase (beta-lactamase superfamily II)